MSTLVPRDDRIDRSALERIIRRAAELQAGERDIGEGLTEGELVRLGDEVGIPGRYLQQALLEERTRAVVQAERGLVASLVGPRYVAAARTVSGEPRPVTAALSHWMTDGELLTVKRRFPDHTSWEPRKDVFASLKRSFEFGGRPYALARAREVVGQVVRLDAARCHVRLVADMDNTRRTHLQAGVSLAAAGVAATGVGFVLGVMAPIALVPAAAGVVIGYAAARGRWPRLERVQVALEQVLDRLEHGEIRVPPAVAGPRSGTFARIANEIKKGLGA